MAEVTKALLVLRYIQMLQLFEITYEIDIVLNPPHIVQYQRCEIFQTLDRLQVELTIGHLQMSERFESAQIGHVSDEGKLVQFGHEVRRSRADEYGESANYAEACHVDKVAAVFYVDSGYVPAIFDVQFMELVVQEYAKTSGGDPLGGTEPDELEPGATAVGEELESGVCELPSGLVCFEESVTYFCGERGVEG